MRLIDADMARDILLHDYRIDAKEYFKRGIDYRTGLAKGIELMEKAPTVDAVPMSVIEDIKTEIEDARFNQINDKTEKAVNYGLNTALAIIDKHTKGDTE